jgi:hypothetical protein
MPFVAPTVLDPRADWIPWKAARIGGATLALGAVAAGCGPSAFIAPEFPARQPTTVAVMPMEDAYFLSREPPPYTRNIAEHLQQHGYQVQALAETKSRLEKANLLHTVRYRILPLDYCKALAVDALLKSRLGTMQEGTSSTGLTSKDLELDLAMVDCRTTLTLWRVEVRKHESPESGQGLAGALIMTAVWAAHSPVEGWIEDAMDTLPPRQ